ISAISSSVGSTFTSVSVMKTVPVCRTSAVSVENACTLAALPRQSLTWPRWEWKRPIVPHSSASATRLRTISAPITVLRVRTIGRHALALGQAVIEVPILVVAWVAFRIDQHELLAFADAQAQLLDAPLHHRAAADQDRLRQLLIHHGLDRAQYALFLALGIDH